MFVLVYYQASSVLTCARLTNAIGAAATRTCVIGGIVMFAPMATGLQPSCSRICTTLYALSGRIGRSQWCCFFQGINQTSIALAILSRISW